MDGDIVVVHAVCGERTCRFSISSGVPLQHLAAALQTLLQLPAPPQRLHYEDDEGDAVTVTSDAELSEAFSLALATCAGGERPTLHLAVPRPECDGAEASPPVAPAAPPPAATTETRRDEPAPPGYDAGPADVDWSARLAYVDTGAFAAAAEPAARPEAAARRASTEKRGPSPLPRVSTMEYLANEVSFHRLIVQTAIEAAVQRAAHSEWTANMERRALIVREQVARMAREVKQETSQLPPPREIADNIVAGLRAAGAASAAEMRRIGDDIADALRQLFDNRSPQRRRSSVQERGGRSDMEPEATTAGATDEKDAGREESDFVVVEDGERDDIELVDLREPPAAPGRSRALYPRLDETGGGEDDATREPMRAAMAQLAEMGFTDTQRNRDALLRSRGFVPEAVRLLLSASQA